MTAVSPASPTASLRPEVVRISHVSKRFTVRKDSSLKERIVTLGRAGRAHKQDFWALSDVSLDIRAGNTIGLIGHNGSGKSTLLKVIGGIIQPTSGTVEQRGRIAALLELGAGFHPDLTGRENVFLNASVLGLSAEETAAQFDAILEFSGVGEFIDTQIKFYSSGMYVRLAFAIAVHTDPDILLVDEVLAVGDEQFQRKCLDKISEFQSEGRTIIIVSHALDQIAALCDRVILMNRGQMVYDGIPVTAIERFRELLAHNGVGEARPDEISTAIAIQGIEIVGDDGTPREALSIGEPFVMRVGVRSYVPVDEWAIGFSIDTAMGQMALASNTDLLQLQLSPLDGVTTVDIAVDGAQLSPGRYVVNANVSGISVDASHSLMQGAHFAVEGSQTTIGPVAAAIRIDEK
ncbi:ABC transporter ATP-binding protein [Microbacterium sp. CPCC 204701]|uniref:ABC transporter ATP-binding protein n=1 Tax=Microbacterium sp. CPCC 204701 TaxID=2493084 RepID=UPI000FD91963|nr:ABC transporter ATP-binding protein [Microbacterium sp. CPCC 204701]